MARRVFKTKQIINLLLKAEVLLSQGQALAAVCRKLSISRQTYYSWRKSYGGMRTEQSKRLKELELENRRLRRLVGDLRLIVKLRKSGGSEYSEDYRHFDRLIWQPRCVRVVVASSC